MHPKGKRDRDSSDATQSENDEVLEGLGDAERVELVRVTQDDFSTSMM